MVVSASASTARTRAHRRSSESISSSAAVWIWSRSQNWKPLGSLSGATLTINALEFSPDTAERDYLLAASRDRHVCVFAPSSSDAPRGEFGSDGWHLLTRFKAHDREIYAACWAPCGTLFATAGRDKKIKLWRVAGDECAPAGRAKPASPPHYATPARKTIYRKKQNKFIPRLGVIPAFRFPFLSFFFSFISIIRSFD